MEFISKTAEKYYMERLLLNKVCIITGAAQGIGREIAHRFAQDGAIVYACDRQEFTSDETRIHPLIFDITDAAAVKNAMMQVFKEAGRIDVLVNNAGVVFNRKIGMITREETELMFRINVIAVLELIQLVSRLMARNGGGSIVNIASVTAVLGSPGQVAYSATKGAIIALTKSAAKELEPQGIRLECTPQAINYLAEQGYDPDFGARPVKRAIQQYVLNDLSKKLLADEVDRDKPIIIDEFGEGLVFRN